MFFKTKEGSVLLSTLVFITFLSMVLIGVDTQVGGGGGLMQVVTSEHQWVQRDYLNAVAVNLAEAGLERALDDISASWASGASYNQTESLGSGSYTVKTVASTGTTYTLQSTGTTNQLIGGQVLDRKLEAVATKGSSGVPYAILSSGNVNFKATTVGIYGAPTFAVHTNGNFLHQGDVSLYTDNGTTYAGVSASGSINATGGGSLSVSEQQSGVNSATLPSTDFTGYEAEASSSGTIVNGNYTVNGGNIGCNGITYIKGNLKLSGNVITRGTLVVEGNVDIKGTLKPNAGSEPTEIIADGNVDINDNGASSATPEIEANIYSAGNVKLWPGTPWIKGSIVAEGNFEFTNANGGTLRIDYQAHSNSKLITQTTVTVSKWREAY